MPISGQHEDEAEVDAVVEAEAADGDGLGFGGEEGIGDHILGTFTGTGAPAIITILLPYSRLGPLWEDRSHADSDAATFRLDFDLLAVPEEDNGSRRRGRNL